MANRGVIQPVFMRNRIHIVFGCVLAGYLGLVGRLVYLQGFQGATLRQEALDSRMREVTLPAMRGSIYDRNGRLLAVSRYSGLVSFDPMEVYDQRKPEKRRAKAEEKLKDALPKVAALLQMPQAELEAKIAPGVASCKANKPNRYVPLKKDVSFETAQALSNADFRSVGFCVTEDSRRIYPVGADAPQIVGFLGGEGKGAAGLERSCGLILAGKQGKVEYEADHRLRELPNTRTESHPALDGLNVVTTLDAQIQHIATQEALKCFEKYTPEGISVVAVEPETGDLLALVSLPTFDPNPGGRKGMTSEAIAAALHDRCASAVYEPGSTLKTITVAAALDQGLISEDSYFDCAGTLKIGKRSLRCDRHGGSGVHGSQNPEGILRRSCNVGSAKIGLMMGAQKLYAAEAAFGLLSPLPLPLPIQQSGHLNLDKRNVENVNNPSRVARVAFGHAITTTPVHVAMAYAAIANDGVLMQPRLVSAYKDSQGRTKREFAPNAVRQVVSARTAQSVRRMLAEVVTSGTGKVASVAGYRVAGKTGTAKKYKADAYVGSFVGFLPASAQAKPKVVILVSVDTPRGAYYGAEVAGPVFQAIARRLADVQRLPKDDPEGTQYRLARSKMKVH